MTLMMEKFVPLDGHKLGSGFGPLLSEIARVRYPRDTAKHIARAWDIDPSTAANVVKGHSSERTVAKAVRAEGWELGEALLTALTGETYTQFIERDLARLRTEQELAHAKLDRIRARHRAVQQKPRRVAAD